MKKNRWSRVKLGLGAICVAAIAACDPDDSARPGGSVSRDSGGADEGAAAWRHHGESALVESTPAPDDEEMQAAIEEARRTAADASEQWRSLPAAEREKWLIKWAAPHASSLDDASSNPGRVEYVWVRPQHWSPFRIEGILVSDPVTDIGFEPGDFVAFPAEELVDWVYRLHDTMDGPRQGGYTVEVLEKRYGSPDE